MDRSPEGSISGGLCVQTWWAVVMGVRSEMDDWWLTVCRSWSTETVGLNGYTAGRSMGQMSSVAESWL